MKQLFYKELRLALHPASAVFLMLSAMVLIPSYPYYIVFFYTGLGVFFTCLGGRENQDVYYTMLLPVSRRQLVGARVLTVMALEGAQVLTVGAFSLLRRSLPLEENAAGMEANLALIGLSLIMLGLFHLIFFEVYYRNVQKVGTAFLLGGAAEFLYVGAVETMAHIVPLFRDKLDTPDPEFLMEKLAVLGVGAAVYAGLTYLSFCRGVRHFERQDL